MATVLNLGLDNTQLYNECEITEVGGRLTLITPIADACNIIGRNAIKLVESMTERDTLILTGPMAVWSYLIVFHIVLHKFCKILYDDGRNGPILIAHH